jgi:Protein of unknown function (DUF1236)
MGEYKEETTMKTRTYVRYGITAIALFASVGIAAAGGTGAGPRWIHPGMSASDNLILSSAQKQTISQTMFNGQAERNDAPVGFTASIGQVLPNSVTLHSLPSNVASQVPAVRSYSYATVEKEILIVNPTNRKVIDIIRQ